MNWDEMSGSKVNSKLADLLKVNVIAVAQDGLIVEGKSASVDYCNSWADIGPLIEKYDVTLNQQKYSIPEAFCRDNFGFACFGVSHKNIKRAAAMCLIKKLEAENAKV